MLKLTLIRSRLRTRCAAPMAALLLSLPLAAAVQEKLSFRSYGLEQGLGNLAVWQVIQDASGFIWAGTEDGLYRFDGLRFKAYGLQDGLPSSYVSSVHQQPDGSFWVGTYAGLARWDGRGFQRVTPAEGLPACQIKALATSQDGTLWVGTPMGLFQRPPGKPFRLAPGWPGGSVSALWAKPGQAQVWAAAWSGSPSLLRGGAGAWQQAGSRLEFGQEPIQALAVDGESRTWARTLTGLWSQPAAGGGFQAFAPALPAVRQRAYLGLDPRGRIRVTTDQGLYTIQAGVPVRLGPAEGLPIAWVSTAMEDREGSLWVGSNGLFRLQGGGAWKAHTLETGLPNQVIWCILRDQAGRLLLGTDQGLIQETAGGWRQVPGTGHAQIRSVLKAGDGTYFLAAGSEVLRWDPRRQTVVRFGADAGVRSPSGRIFRLALDATGALWVATDGGGLLRGTGQGDHWLFQRQQLPGEIPAERIMDLHQDRAGRLWVAGSKGLAMSEQGDRGHWHRFTTADGLLHEHVAYLAGASNGDLLLAYFEPLGLTRAGFKDGKLTVREHLNQSRGLASDKVYLMGEDAHQQLWVGSGIGVDLLKPGQPVEHFSRSEGLVNDDTDSMAFLAEANGDVWIGTSKGLARFDAASYQGAPKPPATAVLTVKLGSQAPFWTPGATLTAPHSGNTFEVAYAGLSFIREGSVHYQVRLVGLEPEWRLTEDRSARYPALGPGLYEFEVRARVGHGAWGPVSAVVFRILPAWWQTWWCYSLIALGGAGLLLAAIRWRELALQRGNRILALMVDERTREVQAKAAELELANEALRTQSLTDPLTGLRNRRFLGVCMPEDVAQVRRVHQEVAGDGRSRARLNIDLLFLMVDIDHFKTVNDDYGHAAGDLVLQQVAAVLRQATRDTDTVVRWGGEEFLVVARNAARDESAILAERIRAMVAAHLFDLGDGRSLRRTCSVGFTDYPFTSSAPDLFSWEQVVDLADHCLYAAKRGGRNAWVGLIPTDSADPAQLKAGLPMAIQELVDRSLVTVLHSFPEGRGPNWQLAP